MKLDDFNKDEIKVVELFAGVGGFRLGLERTSKIFNTIWANQWEPGRKKQWAYECYTNHFGIHDKHVNKDISTVIDDIPEHNLLVGGFPCQDYSVARTKASGIEGKKGVLWWSIKDIIDKKKPQLILLENVDRLIKSPSKQKGRDFGIMLRSLYDAGYDAEWRVINASDYGNVQRRRRVFIFAFKNSLTKKLYSNENQLNIINKIGLFAKSFPATILEENKKRVLINVKEGFKDLVDVSNEFKTKFYNSGSMINGEILSLEVLPKQIPPKTLSDVVEREDVEERFFINGNVNKFQDFKNTKRVRRINPEGEIYFYSEGSMTFPDRLDKPARTMLTSEGSLNRSTHVIFDPKTGRPRTLMPVECERINGFDDNWTNTGMPLNMRYFCMGNALVVPIVESLAKNILEIWRGLKNES